MLSGRWSLSFTQVSAVLYYYLFFPAVVSPESCPAGLLWLYRIKACEGRSNLPRQAIQVILLQTVRGTDFGSVSPNTSQHFAGAWIFCPADSAGTKEGELAKRTLLAWQKHSWICVGSQKFVPPFSWHQWLGFSLPAPTWVTHVLKWHHHYHAWVLCNWWDLVPLSPRYP